MDGFGVMVGAHWHRGQMLWGRRLETSGSYVAVVSSHWVQEFFKLCKRSMEGLRCLLQDCLNAMA